MIEHEIVHVFAGTYEGPIRADPLEADGYAWVTPEQLARTSLTIRRAIRLGFASTSEITGTRWYPWWRRGHRSDDLEIAQGGGLHRHGRADLGGLATTQHGIAHV